MYNDNNEKSAIPYNNTYNNVETNRVWRVGKIFVATRAAQQPTALLFKWEWLVATCEVVEAVAPPLLQL